MTININNVYVNYFFKVGHEIGTYIYLNKLVCFAVVNIFV